MQCLLVVSDADANNTKEAPARAKRKDGNKKSSVGRSRAGLGRLQHDDPFTELVASPRAA
eukprot:scaffold123163_cov20-Prasinocladus_malaysianus.AAC.1